MRRCPKHGVLIMNDGEQCKLCHPPKLGWNVIPKGMVKCKCTKCGTPFLEQAGMYEKMENRGIPIICNKCNLKVMLRKETDRVSKR